jgi:simple sugar transport system ATP-binding protein
VSQPTWGVDVGASAFIRQTIIDLSRNGAAVLVVSEELDELFEICDRLLVICQGKVSPPLMRTTTDREEIGLLMTGRTMNEPTSANGSGDIALQD